MLIQMASANTASPILMHAVGVIDAFAVGGIAKPEALLSSYVICLVEKGNPVSASIESDVAWLLACFRRACEDRASVDAIRVK